MDNQQGFSGDQDGEIGEGQSLYNNSAATRSIMMQLLSQHRRHQMDSAGGTGGLLPQQTLQNQLGEQGNSLQQLQQAQSQQQFGMGGRMPGMLPPASQDDELLTRMLLLQQQHLAATSNNSQMPPQRQTNQETLESAAAPTAAAASTEDVHQMYQQLRTNAGAPRMGRDLQDQQDQGNLGGAAPNAVPWTNMPPGNNFQRGFLPPPPQQFRDPTGRIDTGMPMPMPMHDMLWRQQLDAMGQNMNRPLQTKPELYSYPHAPPMQSGVPGMDVKAAPTETLPQKRKRTVRRKPPDMPRRPLSAYNLFFSEERERILQEMEGTDKKDKPESSSQETTSDKAESTTKSTEAGTTKNKDTEADTTTKDKDTEAESTTKNKDTEAATTKTEDSSAEASNPSTIKALLRPMVPSQKKRRPHRKTHGKISFKQLAQMVGQRWKALPEDRRHYYQGLAEEDSKRQKLAMEQYYKNQAAKETGTGVAKLQD